MKRATTLLIAMLLAVSAMAQQPYKAYCSIWGNTSSPTIGYAYIDYGQEDMSRNWLVSDSGKGIFFNSIIGILNYMSERGWELEAAYDTQTPNILASTKSDTRQTLIMSKLVTSKEQITDGIYTKEMYKNRR